QVSLVVFIPLPFLFILIVFCSLSPDTVALMFPFSPSLLLCATVYSDALLRVQEMDKAWTLDLGNKNVIILNGGVTR
ncbi:hypothetical protein ACQP3C_28690, partial [Escherichia coli]